MYFINEEKISKLLAEEKFNKGKFLKILEKAKKLKGLSLDETALLLNLDQNKNKKELNLLFKTAREIKESIYGSRLVLFAPLYLGNC